MKIKFYLQYFINKFFRNLFEVKTPKLQVYILGVIYVFSKFYKKIDYKNYSNFSKISTIFGKFYIRPNTFDAICALPDFERPDVDFTIKILNKLRERSITYLDIGANFGLYSILIANKFIDSQTITIYGFEPFVESYNLFNKNIELNNLNSKIKAYNFGLSNFNGEAYLIMNTDNPGSNSINFAGNYSVPNTKISLKTLDEFIQEESNEILFIKIDIEGSEQAALDGGKKYMSSFKEVYIMVEDFMDVSIVDYLKNNNFVCLAKKTPYNSFWYKKNEK
jgi:FkbM family methyltransferase